MGRVGSPHGVRGAVRVQALSEDPSSLLDHPTWWIRNGPGADADLDTDPASWTSHRVVTARLNAATLVAEFERVTSRDQALALRGALVGVPRETLPPLAADEYYRSDVLGMAVVNRKGTRLGDVVDFVDGGAHAILRVARQDAEDRLIPWVPAFVDRIDIAARRIHVDWGDDY